jgi:hypothetical protein
MRAKFSSMQTNMCGLEVGDIAENYYAPAGGGYVRDSNNRQVCEKLYLRGSTLKWSGTFPLIDLIRREYKRRKACNIS